MAQYRLDKKQYVYQGVSVNLDQQKIYMEYGTLGGLVFDEEKELSLFGFHERFEEWQHEKLSRYKEKQIELENLKKKKNEEKNREQEIKYRIQQEQNQRNIANVDYESSLNTIIKKEQAKEKKTNDDYKKEILPMIFQQEEIVRDSRGVRWIRCETCGIIEEDGKFVSYGGMHHANLGICKTCRRRL